VKTDTIENTLKGLQEVANECMVARQALGKNTEDGHAWAILGGAINQAVSSVKAQLFSRPKPRKNPPAEGFAERMAKARAAKAAKKAPAKRPAKSGARAAAPKRQTRRHKKP